MTDTSKKLQAQFSGFYNTPHLFLEPALSLNPLITTKQLTPTFEGSGLEKIRLGQRVERFVTTELLLNKNIKILAENPQIQTQNNITVGELDCLYLQGKQPIHLEIQFKFYLYDESLGATEIERCIGPMRRDSLLEKLTKLKTKQLPLLYANETKPLLSSLNFRAEDFIQKIYFKAQIFVPFGKQIQLKRLNPKCIYGFYFKYTELPKFKNCKFYKPKKTDWLLDVTANVSWKTYGTILPELQVYEAEKYAPLLWLKFENGEVFKCFMVV